MSPEAVPPAGMSGPPGWFLRAAGDQRVAFLIVGAINTGVGFAGFAGFLALFGQGLRPVPPSRYLVALVCAHVVAVLVAFMLYRVAVFRVRGRLLGDLWRFETVYLLTLAVNVALLPLLVELVQLPVLPAQALIVLVTAVMSWMGHRNYSFRRPVSPASPRR